MPIRKNTHMIGESSGPARQHRRFSRTILVSLSLLILAASVSLFIMRSARHPEDERNLAKEARTSPAPTSAAGTPATSATPGTPEEEKPNDRSANTQQRIDKRAQKSVAGITAREKLFISRIRELAAKARQKQLESEGKAEKVPASNQSLASVPAAGESVVQTAPFLRAPIEKTPVFSILRKPEQSTKQTSHESASLSSANSNVQKGQTERVSAEQVEVPVSTVVERVAENLPQRKLMTETQRVAREQSLNSGAITASPDTTSKTTIGDGKSIAERPAPLAGANDSGSLAAQQEKPVSTAAPTFKAGDLRPKEERLVRARPFNGDLRDLPQTPPKKRNRPERDLQPNPRIFERAGGIVEQAPAPGGTTPSAPAPPPIASFDGLDLDNFGDGWPPDTVGDVGPTYYIQNINTSIGIYRKSDGVRVAAFSFDTFMSQGNFGNLCDTDNFGDPVVLYDTFEDRWIITDFAFQLDGGNNVINPPGAFECFAVSQSGDPVAGGWNFYSINTTGGLGDYPKLGIWPDGLYMSVNMFDYAAAGSFQNVRVYAFNKAQMYAGAATVQVVSFDAPSSDFTILPSNARLQTGTPTAGTPNFFVSTWQFLNALSVYKFHVDWERISTSTFTGPDTPLASSSWPNAAVPNAPSQGGSSLDVLQIRAMMQNQYSNISGVESLWVSHTVRRENTTGFAAPRYYQVNVTGGTVAANITQAATWDPDGANVIHRFMPSVAVNRMGDMALGYSTSSNTTKPAIKYAGRLAADPVNTLSLTEQVLIQGTGTQSGTSRWGDYSAMTLDPDGCTFWYTNEYYAVDGLNYLTRIGSFAFPACTPVGSGGTVSGTVTATMGGTPISGATVTFGSRTAMTNGSGFYSFSNIPAGTYPNIGASFPGYVSGTSAPVLVTDAATTTKDFSLNTAPMSGCLTDTTQSDFQTGVPTSVDLNAAGDFSLTRPVNIDQQNTTLGMFGNGISTTSWSGQTFVPSVSGQLTRADINLFCSGCSGSAATLAVSVRATSGGIPTGADLASATVLGSTSGAASYFAATFGTPASLTAGTTYALVIRNTADPSPGTQAVTRSNNNAYANGARVTSTNSGTSWNSQSTDIGFVTYMKSTFAASGNQISGLKDANPGVGSTPTWTALSWNVTVPANTNVMFQVAASNNKFGPFNFVGPDGTSATFFTTSGASLSQFNGNRYLKYKAFLSTTNTTVSPTVNDVTVCFLNTAPTDATLNWFTAESHASEQNRSAGGVLLRWQTGFEVANLGFHIYREDAGKRVRITRDLVAGSALLVGPRTVLGAGHTYVWRDVNGGNDDSAYWLESIDLDGFSTWYGPVRAASTGITQRLSSAQVGSNSKMLDELSGGAQATVPLEPRAPQVPMTIAGKENQWPILGQSAIKISVQRAGWYRVSQSELVAAGLDRAVDPRLLQLFVDGQEQPINVVTERDGELSAIEFYGIGIDSPYTNSRTYWLASGNQPGKRIDQRHAAGPDVTGGSFPYTVERRERTVYFAGLRNGGKENFFGSIIAREPVNQSLVLSHLETNSSQSATVEVALQGVTASPHSVSVALNDSYLGTISFNSQSEGFGIFNIQPSQLIEGQNIVQLVSTGGASDISLVDHIRLTYPHRYAAKDNALRFTIAGKQMVTVEGFSSPAIRVLDVTNPSEVQELTGIVKQQKTGDYEISLNPAGTESRTLLAIAGDLARPASLTTNIPSSLRQPGNGANLVIITRREFFASLNSLVSLRQSQGYSVAVIDVEDIYDEFSYGQKTPQALKDFCTYAAANWKKAPRFVMLVGDASFDPKDYLGFGDSDLVPTRLIDTQYMETASDDWLVDFNGDGLPEMAIGRLPARSAEEAFRLATKITNYDGQRSVGSLLLVSDDNDTYDFESASNTLRGLIPADIRVEAVERSLQGTNAKAALIDAINRGQVIVNYNGHGSSNQWRDNFLTSADAGKLLNVGELSMFVMMTCLNGYFQDAALDSLSESLLKADGAAIAVWGSSGMTTPDIQAILNQQLYRMVFNDSALTIGEATARAKAAVASEDVRRTWILLGDPTTRLSR